MVKRVPTSHRFGGLFSCLLLAVVSAATVQADTFDEEDLERWEGEYQAVVKEGRALFTSGELGNNAVACAQCHPNATNVHPETYPKFQQQLGKVAQLWEMVNWCIRNPLEGENLPADSADMTALLTYMHHERRGVELAPGKH